jgi:hypothetical protein
MIRNPEESFQIEMRRIGQRVILGMQQREPEQFAKLVIIAGKDSAKALGKLDQRRKRAAAPDCHGVVDGATP